MGYLIGMTEIFRLKGLATVECRRVCPRSGKTICSCSGCDPRELGQVYHRETQRNTLAAGWKQAMVSDLVNQTALSLPRVMAFSKSIVLDSPFPTALTSEIRSPASVYKNGTSLQIISILDSGTGNSPSGNIKSVGFYYGEDATTTLLTGSLGSLINTMNFPKDSSTEATIQYEVIFD